MPCQFMTLLYLNTMNSDSVRKIKTKDFFRHTAKIPDSEILRRIILAITIDFILALSNGNGNIKRQPNSHFMNI